MNELEHLEQTIFHEIKRTEKSYQDTNLREDTDRAMPRIDTLNWVLNEILVLKRMNEIKKANDWRSQIISFHARPLLYRCLFFMSKS